MNAIARFWRRHCSNRTALVVKRFVEHGITVKMAGRMGFERVLAHVRSAAVIDLGKACIQRIQMLCINAHRVELSDADRKLLTVRVFLASFLIRRFPARSFESIGPAEEHLIMAAMVANEKFERICESLLLHGDSMHFTAAVDADDRSDFSEAMLAYARLFHQWKNSDECKVAARIRAAIKSLIQDKGAAPPENAALRSELDMHIDRLRMKLCAVAGRKALEHLDRELGRAPAPAVAKLANAAPPANFGGALLRFGDTLTVEELAHEILLNPAFVLTEEYNLMRFSANTPTMRSMFKTFHSAYISTLAADLELPQPCFTRVHTMVQAIVDGLKDTGGDPESKRLISDVQERELKAFSATAEGGGAPTWAHFMQLCVKLQAVAEHISCMCGGGSLASRWAPIHLTLLTNSNRPKALTSALEYFMETVTAVRMSVANTRIRLLAPVIQDHGLDYERGKFQAKLDAGTVTLERTRAWLRLAIVEGGDAHALLSAPTSGKEHEAAVDQAHARAMLALVSDASRRPEAFPEVIAFDAHKLACIANDLEAIARTIARLSMVKAMAPPGSREALCRLAMATSSAESFVAAGGVPADLADAVAKIDASPQHMGLKFVRPRVLGAFVHVVQTGVMPDPDPSRFPLQIGAWAAALVEHAATFRRVSDFNMRVHGARLVVLMREEAAAALALA